MFVSSLLFRVFIKCREVNKTASVTHRVNTDQVDSVLALVLIANPAVCTSPMTAGEREGKRGEIFGRRLTGF